MMGFGQSILIVWIIPSGSNSFPNLKQYHRVLWSFIVHRWIHLDAPIWRSIWWSPFIPMSQYIHFLDLIVHHWIKENLVYWMCMTRIVQVYHPATNSTAKIFHKICGIENSSYPRSPWHPHLRTNSFQAGENDADQVLQISKDWQVHY